MRIRRWGVASCYFYHSRRRTLSPKRSEQLGNFDSLMLSTRHKSRRRDECVNRCVVVVLRAIPGSQFIATRNSSIVFESRSSVAATTGGGLPERERPSYFSDFFRIDPPSLAGGYSSSFSQHYVRDVSHGLQILSWLHFAVCSVIEPPKQGNPAVRTKCQNFRRG